MELRKFRDFSTKTVHKQAVHVQSLVKEKEVKKVNGHRFFDIGEWGVVLIWEIKEVISDVL